MAQTTSHRWKGREKKNSAAVTTLKRPIWWNVMR